MLIHTAFKYINALVKHRWSIWLVCCEMIQHLEICDRHLYRDFSVGQFSQQIIDPYLCITGSVIFVAKHACWSIRNAFKKSLKIIECSFLQCVVMSECIPLVLHSTWLHIHIRQRHRRYLYGCTATYIAGIHLKFTAER